MASFTSIASGSVKLDWGALPEPVRTGVETRLGGPIAEAVTQAGGFSPGAAARVRTAGGRRAFVKSIHADLEPFGHAAHRREAGISRSLIGNPNTSQLLDSFEWEGWVTLIFEDIAGRHPALPWEPRELHSVCAGIEEMLDRLTPAPDGNVRTIGEASDEGFRGWRNLRDHPGIASRYAGGRLLPDLKRYADLESGWAEGARGRTLVHGDIRADQILISDGRVVVVDWPHASIGAGWTDLAGFFPSVTMQGGPSPETLVRRCRLISEAPADALTSFVAALTGFFLWNSLQPPPPRLPTLREFQRRQGDVALAWLNERAG